MIAAKKKRDEDQAKRDANDRDISEYFKGAGSKAQPKAKVSENGSVIIRIWV